MRRPAALALLLASACAGCGGLVPVGDGFIVAPAPSGDAVDRRVDELLRSWLGVWTGMPLGVARERIVDRTGATYAGVASTGGITTFSIPDRGYLYVYARTRGDTESRDHVEVCGLRARSLGEPGLSDVLGRLREALDGQPQRRSQRFSIVMREHSFALFDLERCPERAPALEAPSDS